MHALISYSAMKVKIEGVIDSTRLRLIDLDLQVPDYRKFMSHNDWE